MDLSYWNNLAMGVKIHPTKKQYFNRFLWRLVIHAEAGRLLESKEQDLELALDHRKTIVGQRGFYWRQNNSNLDKVDLSLLQSIRDIKTTYGNDIRVRVEEPSVQFYAYNEHTLMDIANKLSSPLCIEEINGPANSNEEQLLQSGAIIRKNDIGYRYKIILKDGRYPTATKQQLLAYLNNVGDVVKLSKGSRKMLDSKYTHVWGVWFYSNSDDIITFLNLIAPTAISNIHELVIVDK
jgi:hypothetical protein